MSAIRGIPLVPLFQISLKKSELKTTPIPFGIVACTFSDNLSRNIVGPARRATLPSKKGDAARANVLSFC